MAPCFSCITVQMRFYMKPPPGATTSSDHGMATAANTSWDAIHSKDFAPDNMQRASVERSTMLLNSNQSASKRTS